MKCLLLLGNYNSREDWTSTDKLKKMEQFVVEN